MLLGLRGENEAIVATEGDAEGVERGLRPPALKDLWFSPPPGKGTLRTALTYPVSVLKSPDLPVCRQTFPSVG